MKQKSAWYCSECGHKQRKWSGQCPQCTQWNSLHEEVEIDGSESRFAAQPVESARPVRLKEISHKDIKLALEKMKPIAQTMAEKIESIRDQARDHYNYASSWAEANVEELSVRTPSGEDLALDDGSLGLDDLTDDTPESPEAETRNRFRQRG